jgi:DNA helicase-2/ATP-dependent DNA helicase PcrA
MQLTPQQQAVVNHTYGPALVFAVAGAGKTTALEARIVRLVQEGIFPPEQILAAAYNTAVRDELGARLRQRGCQEVEVTTLHALGLRAVRLAWEAGLLPHLQASAFQQIESAQETILNAALSEARQRKVPYLRELEGLDRGDFLTWVGNCKGNLFYPTLADLSALVRQSRHAQQAPAPSPTEWYLPFFQLVERVQQARGLLTFDDQLRLGWEVMVSHAAIRTRLQRAYASVFVDEFQDVNLAQYLILDILTAPHRNYMVVGDDDQTIYEWRGANPRFILNFGRDYNATAYVMSENFRCPIGPLTLANGVIRHNQHRYPKSLRLTQGVGGVMEITRSSSRRQMGQAIVANVRAHLQAGEGVREMAVLVRAKAQTPPVELALIEAAIPYEVVGSQPFYARWEITTLVAYCRLARVEAQLQRGKALSAAEQAQLLESWDAIYRHPKRYISTADAERVRTALAGARTPITHTLRTMLLPDKPHIQARLGELATLLAWLSGAFGTGQGEAQGGKSAHAVLHALERKLGYCDYLERRGTLSEAGVDEAENVRQFIEEAKHRGTLLDYLTYLKRLAEEQAAQQKGARGNLLTIRTIHSAKGLEWKVVIIPSCDDGNLPHRKNGNVEEERRLLYVALTRTRRDLYIYYLAAKPSSFLEQAKWPTLMSAVAHIRRALHKPPAQWSLDETRAIAIAVPQLGLLEYLQSWHTWQGEAQAGVVNAACAYLENGTRAGPRLDAPTAARLLEAWRALGTTAVVEKVDIKQGVSFASPSKRRQGGSVTPGVPTTPASVNAPTHRWETFDEVVHPQYGRGIIISTTTTTRGRELKVQFPDGNLRHLRDDDPQLLRG